MHRQATFLIGTLIANYYLDAEDFRRP